MKKPESATDWVNLIKIASDPASPFKGMVDLQGLFALPLPMQWEIFNALTDKEKVELKAVYGANK